MPQLIKTYTSVNKIKENSKRLISPIPGNDKDSKPTKTPRKKASQEGYFQLKVKDNGCGMNHDKIPDLLGRVLSGSKYGVRQTRGKFGLGK